jgi:hypothetical protein
MNAAATRSCDAFSSGLPQKAHVTTTGSSAACPPAGAGACGSTPAQADITRAITNNNTPTPIVRLMLIDLLLDRMI